MVDVSYQIVLNTLQTVALLVGIAYYVMSLNYTRRNQEISLRNQEQTLKTRSITLFHQTLGSLITSPIGNKHLRILDEIQVSNYEEHRELSSKNVEYYDAWRWAFLTIDLMGVYLKESVVDIGMVAKFNPWWFIGFWGRYKDIVYEMRKLVGPTYFSNMDYFMDSLQKYLEEHPELAT